MAAALLIATQASLAEDQLVACRGDASVCQTLVKGEQELESMLVSGAVNIVAGLFPDDAVWTLASGERRGDRQTAGCSAIDEQLAPASSVFQHGTVAIVVWKESCRNRAMDREQHSFGTDTWMLKGNG
ncbi:hypothetical protein FHS96_005746 [Sphingomonas zeicaulis]|uniref:hypothetical protein n=1 Tax=Sphingomonas zeicaulis TaxID=1632740 RepID=UPI003D20B0BE